jgi:hypothetical protein
MDAVRLHIYSKVFSATEAPPSRAVRACRSPFGHATLRAAEGSAAGTKRRSPAHPPRAQTPGAEALAPLNASNRGATPAFKPHIGAIAQMAQSGWPATRSGPIDLRLQMRRTARATRLRLSHPAQTAGEIGRL